MCFQYLESALKHDTNLIPILKFLCELCLHFDPTSSSVSHNDIINLARPSFVLDLTSVQLNQARSTRSRQTTTKPNIVRQLELLLDSGLTVEWCTIDEKESEMQDKINLLWAALVCLKYIRYGVLTTFTICVQLVFSVFFVHEFMINNSEILMQR